MKKVLFSCLVLLLGIITTAQATSLQALFDGGTITADDKLFSNWSTNYNDGLIDFSAIEVTALEDNPLNPGIRFETNGQITVTDDNGLYFSYFMMFQY